MSGIAQLAEDTSGSESEELEQENVFASPWKDSDTVLVVEKTKFHVHRSILTLQSPVFKAMLDGHFKESRQKKITLEGKSSEDMLQFLKLLYPHNMIKRPLISLSGENAFKMLVLADEYQAEDVINQCLEEVKVKPENAFRVLAYANKYNRSVREKCVQVIKRSVSTKEVEEEFSKLDDEIIKQLLLTKCRFLESVVQKGNEVLISLLECALKGQAASSRQSKPCTYCGYGSFSVSDFSDARQCKHCLKDYEQTFAEYVYKLGGAQRDSMVGREKARALVDLLKDTDDVREATTTKYEYEWKDESSSA